MELWMDIFGIDQITINNQLYEYNNEHELNDKSWYWRNLNFLFFL